MVDSGAAAPAVTALRMAHTDRLGSVMAVTSSTGAVTERFAYNAFGVSNASSAGYPFRYTGQRIDPETGLMFYKARVYSTTLGRFLQTDPIGTKDDLNLYAYVGNDPVNRTDPSGKAAGDADCQFRGQGCQDQSALSWFSNAGSNTTLSDWETQAERYSWFPGISGADAAIDIYQGDFASERANSITSGQHQLSLALTRIWNKVQHNLRVYPSAIDPRTGSRVPLPNSVGDKVPLAKRVPWGEKQRKEFIAEWNRRGYDEPVGGWDNYEIHHIVPRAYGGSNDFWNLVPLDKGTHGDFNRFWSGW